MNKKTIITIGAAFLALQCAVTLPQSSSSAAPARRQAAQGATKFGDFTIDNAAKIRIEHNSKNGIYTGMLRGPNLVVRSPEYTMVAPSIDLIMKNNKIVTGNATGGVRVTSRDETAKRTITITCNTAVYTATTNPKDRGIITLKGNVRSVTRDPSLAQPLIVTGEEGFIRMTGADTTVVEITNGSATVTPIEKPRPKPGGGGR